MDEKMPVEDAFDRSAEYYDDWVRKAIPCYDEAFATAVELMPFEAGDEIRVLDLGAGTGLFSWHVSQRYGRASLVLYDVSSQMLKVAGERFSALGERASIVQADYLELDAYDAYDAVISSLSIHHLEHEDKRALFSQVYRALRDGGVFINVDQIAAPSPFLRDTYWKTWLEKVRSAGAEEEKVQESIRRRRELDHDASLADQLSWMADAGFADVDCVYKHYFIGVFHGLKPPGDAAGSAPGDVAREAS